MDDHVGSLGQDSPLSGRAGTVPSVKRQAPHRAMSRAARLRLVSSFGRDRTSPGQLSLDLCEGPRVRGSEVAQLRRSLFMALVYMAASKRVKAKAGGRFLYP